MKESIFELLAELKEAITNKNFDNAWDAYRALDDILKSEYADEG